MDFQTFDLTLAILHHLAVFALFGILTAELLLVRQGMSASDVRRVSSIDVWYGVIAGVILVVGFSRAIWAAKKWDFYSHNLMFHAKIGTFLVIGLLSILPTMEIIRWRRALKAGESILPAPAQIAAMRRILWIEVALFALLPVFAAAMARGFGT